MHARHTAPSRAHPTTRWVGLQTRWRLATTRPRCGAGSGTGCRPSRPKNKPCSKGALFFLNFLVPPSSYSFLMILTNLSFAYISFAFSLSLSRLRARPLSQVEGLFCAQLLQRRVRDPAVVAPRPQASAGAQLLAARRRARVGRREPVLGRRHWAAGQKEEGRTHTATAGAPLSPHSEPYWGGGDSRGGVSPTHFVVCCSCSCCCACCCCCPHCLYCLLSFSIIIFLKWPSLSRIALS